jgi:glucokinase
LFLLGALANAQSPEAYPGLADCRQGVTKFLPNLPTQWRDVPVTEMPSKAIGCPVRLLNDARVVTLGEFTFGG